MLDMTGQSLFPDWERNFFRITNFVLFFQKCRIVPKNEKGTLWDSLLYILLQDIKKVEGGLF